MSTKASIFLTRNGDHWYHDCIDNTVVLEISQDQIKDFESCFYQKESGHLIISLKKNSELARVICSARGHYDDKT